MSETPYPVDDFLQHFGVKGMKWGVIRKNYEDVRNTPTVTMNLTTRNGNEVTLVESRKGKVAAALGVVGGEKSRQNAKNYRDFTVYSEGRKVGNASLNEVSKDEVNLVWLGVNPNERGKGFGSSVFDAGVEYARSKGYKTISLEVPGNAPDALHIYEKRGFKLGERISDPDEDPTWGGLTKMEYTIPKRGK